MNVFKNLRAILTKHKDNMPVLAVAELLAEIDEAEADCCEWKPYKQYKYIILPPHEKHHGMWRSELKTEPYCSRCGKPIKITEVD